jgi:hypothetical protein
MEIKVGGKHVANLQQALATVAEAENKLGGVTVT